MAGHAPWVAASVALLAVVGVMLLLLGGGVLGRPAPSRGACCAGEKWDDPPEGPGVGAQESALDRVNWGCVSGMDAETCAREQLGAIVAPRPCLRTEAESVATGARVLCCVTDTFCDMWFVKYRGTRGRCNRTATLADIANPLPVGYCVEAAAAAAAAGG